MLKGLEGIKVIDTANNVAGPLAARMLADYGADVIHIEPPGSGDMARSALRHFVDIQMGGRIIESDVDTQWEFVNVNKRGMTLNMANEKSREILYGMLKTADVFLNNYRPRELEKFKLDYETIKKINPRIIFANITGYGIKGPDRNLPGYDFNVFWTRTGIMHVFTTPDQDPFTTPIAFGDRTTALTFAYGISMALLIRERTGVGQDIYTSLQQAGIFVNAQDVGDSLVTGKDRQNKTRKEMANVLLNSYKLQDGRWIRFALNQPDRYWQRFCKAIGREDLEHDPRFGSYLPRLENHAALFDILEKTFAEKTLAEWKPRLDEAGLPWAPILSLPEVTSDEQARANGFFTPIEHPTYGHIEIVANPVILGQTPATVRMPAPEFGQHTEEVLLEYGYTWDDIAKFKEDGVIG
jgi:crotonobetainyl-CoA:carnitine CoA-transferase CaiB-like acyl-CoA transferase